MKALNINHHIKVKLTNDGKKIYINYFDKFSTLYGKDILKVDEDGFTEFQLWDFINMFGKYFYNGSLYQIIEMNNIYIDEKYLQDVIL